MPLVAVNNHELDLSQSILGPIVNILFRTLDASNRPRLNLPPKDPNMDIMFLYTNNFVIFYVIKFWRILYIYYNKKVK